MTKEELKELGSGLAPFDEGCYRSVLQNWDALAKPLDGLGEYERQIARLGAIQGTQRPVIDARSLLVFLSDNGIVAEGVSQCDATVTRQVALAMAQGASTVCVMAPAARVRVCPVDVGMAGEKVEGIANRRVRSGSRSFLREPAMTAEETLAAIQAGYQTASERIAAGDTLLLLGEMGIGNTSTATAAACALLGEDPLPFTGRGAGLSDEGLRRKGEIIQKALRSRPYDKNDALEVLSQFGGYDLAAMVGALLSAARRHTPVVLDGLITLCGALLAERLFPGLSRVCLASHTPREPMGRRILSELGLRAPIDAGIALGEGTGGVLLVPQLDVCLALYNQGRRFEGIGVEAYQRFDTKDE